MASSVTLIYVQMSNIFINPIIVYLMFDDLPKVSPRVPFNIRKHSTS